MNGKYPNAPPCFKHATPEGCYVGKKCNFWHPQNCCNFTRQGYCNNHNCPLPHRKGRTTAEAHFANLAAQQAHVSQDGYDEYDYDQSWENSNAWDESADAQGWDSEQWWWYSGGWDENGQAWTKNADQSGGYLAKAEAMPGMIQLHLGRPSGNGGRPR